MRQHLSFREHFRRGNARDDQALAVVSPESTAGRGRACRSEHLTGYSREGGKARLLQRNNVSRPFYVIWGCEM